jgi:serine/threonine-protein kinase
MPLVASTPVPTRASLTPPTGYTRVVPLAKGGLGTVELVLRLDGRFRRLYAQKRLHAHLRDEPEIRELFLEEARLAGQLRHPNVVPVLDVGEDAEGPFLVMEYIDGMSLNEVVRALRAKGDLMPIAVALRIVRQAALGLGAAHELVADDGTAVPLVHRDISPQNILIGFDGVVRVADFGIAKAVGADGQSTSNALKGKYWYMSPEQLRFEPVDARSDLFALGIVLWEIVAGDRLYPGRQLDVVARRIMHEPPPELAGHRSDAPMALERLLFELLAKDRALRIPNARTLVSRIDVLLRDVDAEEGAVELAPFMEEHFASVKDELQARRTEAVRTALARGAADGTVPDALDPTVLSAPPFPDPPRRSRAWWIAGLLAALVTGAAAAAWIALGGNDAVAPSEGEIGAAPVVEEVVPEPAMEAALDELAPAEAVDPEVDEPSEPAPSMRARARRTRRAEMRAEMIEMETEMQRTRDWWEP